MERSKKVIYLLVYWYIYSGLLKYFGIDSKIIDYVPDLFAIYLGCLFIRKQTDVKISSLVGRPIQLLFFFFIFTGFISGFINQANPISVLWGAHFYFCYLFLLMAMLKCFEPEDVLKLRKILIQGLVVNMVAVLIEVLVLDINGDPLGGTFWGNANGYTFMVPCLFLLTAEYYHDGVTKELFYFCLAVMVFFAIAGEVKIVYFTLPIIIYSIYVFQKDFNYKHIFILIVGFLLIIPFYQYFMKYWYEKEYVEKVFTTEYIEKETSSKGFGGDFNRSTSIEQSMVFLLKDPVSMVIGHGFGASSTSSLFVSDFAQKHQRLVYQYFSPSYLLAEVGWTGFLLFLLVHVFLLLLFYRWYRDYKDDDVMRYWSSIGVCSVLIQFLFIWFNNHPVINNYPMVILWGLIFIAVKYRLLEIEEGREETEVM